MHGARDAVVAPANADAFEAQWSAWLQARGVDRPQRSETRDDTNAAGTFTRTERDAAGRPWLMSVRIAELGHAWPGGDPSGSWTDASAPDGSALLFAFLREVAAP
jgi:poly(3-hydroxybutyrate) depolymerase